MLNRYLAGVRTALLAISFLLALLLAGCGSKPEAVSAPQNPDGRQPAQNPGENAPRTLQVD